MDWVVRNRKTAMTVRKYSTAFRSSVPPSSASSLVEKSKAPRIRVSRFPVREMMEQMPDIMYPTNSTAKLTTAAMT